MVRIRVGFEVVSAQTERLAGVSGGLGGRVEAAGSAVDDMLSGGWSGAAASAFGEAFAEWDAAARDSVRVLERLVAGLGATTADFAETEQGAVDTSQRLQSDVPTLDLAAIMGGR